ncbi:neutral/alkaline ceramidase [Janibacter sp. DB-40]|uniref:neutral/alkaline ceramidase n=1 Tax=Janibacter sp. DB-40 TaxID=3028808 RepID=UPI002406D2CC|nr:neutral/alkaline ceramidase [Janibacter sp. DB-40]
MSRRTRTRLLTGTLALGLVTPFAASATAAPASADYLVGAGLYDITGAAAETGAFGYAAQQEMRGIQDRLYSHAYVIADPGTDERIVYVSADMGAMFQSVRVEVVKELRERFGDTYTGDNVMLTATHTHVGNSGQAHATLYQIAGADASGAGYSTQNFRAAVDGIVASIVRAHDNLEPGSVSLTRGDLDDATRNRSIPAYEANDDAGEYPTDVDTRMTQLELTDATGEPVGMLNWFAVHPTSFSKEWTHLSADNKGYARYLFAERMGTDPASDDTFVASFANAAEGDVVAVDGNSHSAPGYEGSADERLNVERAGRRQFDAAVRLWEATGEPLTGPVDSRSRWADFGDYTVRDEFTKGDPERDLCTPARGFSFAAGGENGPSNIPGITEGMTRSSTTGGTLDTIEGSALGALLGDALVNAPVLDSCQAEKPVLLPTGHLGWVPTKVPVQLLRLGSLAIVGVPGEPTTMSGRRLEATVQERLAGSGVDTVVVAGLANSYTGYVTTREEFAAQHYEGASTEFGPHTLAAYRQEYADLASAMAEGEPVGNGVRPEDRSGSWYPERPGVVHDDTPIGQDFGDVLTQPREAYAKGETATADFRGAHPKNDLRTNGTFLEVQRRTGNGWRTVLTDRDWDTTYTWEREGIAASRTTVEWRIGERTPPGTYRLVQIGDRKDGWTGSVRPYRGASQAFTVR